MNRARVPVPPVPYSAVVRALAMRVTLDDLSAELVAKGYGISRERADRALDEAHVIQIGGRP